MVISGPAALALARPGAAPATVAPHFAAQMRTVQPLPSSSEAPIPAPVASATAIKLIPNAQSLTFQNAATFGKSAAELGVKPLPPAPIRDLTFHPTPPPPSGTGAAPIPPDGTLPPSRVLVVNASGAGFAPQSLANPPSLPISPAVAPPPLAVDAPAMVPDAAVPLGPSTSQLGASAIKSAAPVSAEAPEPTFYGMPQWLVLVVGGVAVAAAGGAVYFATRKPRRR